VNISTETLAYEVVGLRAVDERYWEVYFAHLKLGVLDTHKMQFRAARHKWASRHKQPC